MKCGDDIKIKHLILQFFAFVFDAFQKAVLPNSFVNVRILQKEPFHGFVKNYENVTQVLSKDSKQCKSNLKSLRLLGFLSIEIWGHV